MRDPFLSKPKGIIEWLAVYRLYRAAFPAKERKPFSVIVKMYRSRKTDVWCVWQRGTLLGFATTINGEQILLDYLAVSRRWQGQGIGTQILQTLQQIYRGKGLFVEIESPYEAVPDRRARLRRKAFYLRCGMTPLNVMASVFGVEMELLGWDCSLDFDQYQGFYRDHYSPRAADHIKNQAP